MRKSRGGQVHGWGWEAILTKEQDVSNCMKKKGKKHIPSRLNHIKRSPPQRKPKCHHAAASQQEGYPCTRKTSGMKDVTCKGGMKPNTASHCWETRRKHPKDITCMGGIKPGTASCCGHLPPMKPIHAAWTAYVRGILGPLPVPPNCVSLGHHNTPGKGITRQFNATWAVGVAMSGECNKRKIPGMGC